mmetsp:Transcript_26382/g.43132  ORF Transcript_26382/g.43132 Transcript_26382/m.43132 type:complete len:234 (-) Transcript_26382:633-1334(-)
MLRVDVQVFDLRHGTLKLGKRQDAIAIFIRTLKQNLQLLEMFRSHLIKLHTKDLRDHHFKLALIIEAQQPRKQVFLQILLRVALPVGDPWMRQRLLRRISFAHLLLQQLADQVFHRVRSGHMVREPWPIAIHIRRAHLGLKAVANLLINGFAFALSIFLWIDVEWRIAVHHHEQDHTQRPHVARVIIFAVLDHLGRRIIWCTAQVIQVLQTRQHFAHAKINQLDGRIFRLRQK